MSEFPGSAKLMLVPGVVHLNEPAAVFEAMVAGWSRQQASRQLGESTVRSREQLVRRFTEFAGAHPWEWTPGDVEDFTVSLKAGTERLALSTIRGYHLTLRLFCDYLTDPRYEWAKQCRDRFGTVPSQVCNEWNTVAHLSDYEGRPQRRPFTYAELERVFDYLDDRVEVIARSGRKGSLVALRDALMIKTVYAFGLRRNELARLDVADLRPNPHLREWGTYGSVHVRFGKSTKGSLPRRRTVLAVPEFDWIVEGLRQWVEQARPLFDAGEHSALWLTERLTRVSVRHVDEFFAAARTALGLEEHLSLHCLRHSYVISGASGDARNVGFGGGAVRASRVSDGCRHVELRSAHGAFEHVFVPGRAGCLAGGWQRVVGGARLRACSASGGIGVPALPGRRRQVAARSVPTPVGSRRS